MKKIILLQNDPVFGEVEKNIEAARAALAGKKADLVILPELFATGYQFASPSEVTALAESVPDGPTCKALVLIAKEAGAAVVAGLVERTTDGRLYNAAAIALPGGILTTYRKLHLFHEERIWFSAGTRLPPVVWTPSGLRVGVMICFDWRFPEVMRSLALDGADVVAHPSNLVRPHGPDGMITRALENVCFAATANRVGEEARGGRPPLRYIGRSQVVSPQGERMAALPAEGAGIIEVEIDPALARQKAVTGCDDLLRARRADLLPLATRRGDSIRRYTLSRHDLPNPNGRPIPDTRPDGKSVAQLEAAAKAGLAPATGRGAPSKAAFKAARQSRAAVGAPDAGPHWDLFLEKDDGSLTTFRLAEEPRPGLIATRVHDHRREYLDFSGELSDGRGRVQPRDHGSVREARRASQTGQARDAGDAVSYELFMGTAGREPLLLVPAGSPERWRFEETSR